MNTPDVPHTIELAGDWSFTYTALMDRTVPPTLPRADAPGVPIAIPGFWDDELERIAAAWPDFRTNPDHRPIALPMPKEAPDASLPNLVGVGRYDRMVEVPDYGRLTFECGPVFVEAWLWLNGHCIHHQPHYSTAWSVALDRYTIPGQTNQLSLVVANTNPRTKGCITRGFKGYSAGVVVSLHVHAGASPASA